MQGTLIKCPTCEESGQRNVLGEITPDGLLVKRIRMNLTNGTTIIQFKGELFIGCNCGFGTTVSYQANHVVL